MTLLFIAAAIAAVPFIFWFLWRRAGPRPDKENAEPVAAMSASVVVHVNTAPLEVPRLPETSLPAEQEELLSRPTEEPPRALPAESAAQSQSGTNASPSQMEPATFDGALPEDNPPAAESDKKAAMPEEEQSAAVTAAAGSQSEAETSTLEDHTAKVEVLSPPESVLLIETADAPRAPQKEQLVPLPAVAAAGPQSGAGTCEEDKGVDIPDDQNGPLEPSSQYPDDVPSLPPTEIPLAGTPPPDGDVKAGHIVLETATALTALPPPDAEGAQAELPHGTEESGEKDTTEASHLYRPPPQKPPRQTTARPVTQSATRPVFDLALDIRVRLTFDRSEYCEVRLLPERTPELDTEVDVKSGGTSLHLVAQEEWYEDLSFVNIGERLRQGLELKGLLADHRRARWLLTGREIYVLASHPRASGFVSTTQLVLGRSHVVLCAAGLLPQVEAVLNEAGCRGYTKLDEAHGVPSGWVGLRGVAPSRAVPQDSGSDPFYSIKPKPDIEIELEGGVCLRHSIWLAGFPPRIKLLGDVSGPVKVLIDGKEATTTAEGSLAVDGYDLPGQHFVYCEGLSCSRSYSIEEPPDVWEEWPAYHFGQAEICGPLVHLLPEAAGRRIFSVPMTNPLLLGAEPGQIFRCSSRSVKSWKGFVPFDVVWALPNQPYTCDKKTARILQFANAPLTLPQSPKKPVLPWCAAILEASRKGLRIENGSPDGTVLWKEYKKAAWNIWRAAR